LSARTAIALVIALLSPIAGAQALASEIPLESRLTITFSQSEEGSGSTRTVSQMVTVIDSLGELTQDSPTGSQLRIFFLLMRLCSEHPGAAQALNIDYPSGCRATVSRGSTFSATATMYQGARFYPGRNIDPWSSSHPLLVPQLIIENSSGQRISLFVNTSPPQAQAGGTLGDIGTPSLAEVSVERAVFAGGQLTLRGENLESTTAVSIGAQPASISSRSSEELSVTVSPMLSPGKYDLVLHSGYGTLTHINAVRIKAPTPARNLTLRGLGSYLNESHARAISTFHDLLSGDYEKIRCIVNAVDPKIAAAVSLRVCSQIAKGELSKVAAIKEVRSSFTGKGFWVRVYAVG